MPFVPSSFSPFLHCKEHSRPSNNSAFPVHAGQNYSPASNHGLNHKSSSSHRIHHKPTNPADFDPLLGPTGPAINKPPFALPSAQPKSQVHPHWAPHPALQAHQEWCEHQFQLTLLSSLPQLCISSFPCNGRTSHNSSSRYK